MQEKAKRDNAIYKTNQNKAKQYKAKQTKSNNKTQRN